MWRRAWFNRSLDRGGLHSGGGDTGSRDSEAPGWTWGIRPNNIHTVSAVRFIRVAVSVFCWSLSTPGIRKIKDYEQITKQTNKQQKTSVAYI